MDLVLAAIRDLPTTVIDPAGDTTLILSNRKYRLLFQCSSKQLIQACGHFRKTLASGGQPHTELLRDGKVYLTIHEFNPPVIEIILHLVHSLATDVPREPTLPMMIELAKLCDYLDCLPVVKPYARVWMEKYKTGILAISTLKPKINSWIFISYAFRDEQLFRHATAVAQQNLDGKFDPNKLPIPRHIANLINDAREMFFLTLARLLYARQKKLSFNPKMCETRCNMLYLDLVWGISDKGVFPFYPVPRPGQRFVGDNSKDPDRRCPNGKGTRCPNWRRPLGEDVEEHLQKFDTLLPGLDLPEQN